MSIKAAMEEDAQEQRVRPEVGDIFLRGQRLAIVVSVGGTLSWLDEEEGIVEGSLAEFKSRALEPLQMNARESFLDRAWQVASATDFPAADRLLTLRGMLVRALPDEIREIVAWMATLSLGEEPHRLIS